MQVQRSHSNREVKSLSDGRRHGRQEQALVLSMFLEELRAGVAKTEWEPRDDVECLGVDVGIKVDSW